MEVSRTTLEEDYHRTLKELAEEYRTGIFSPQTLRISAIVEEACDRILWLDNEISKQAQEAAVSGSLSNNWQPTIDMAEFTARIKDPEMAAHADASGDTPQTSLT